MWILFAFIAAVSTSLSDVANKIALKKDSSYFVGWFQLLLLLPFTLSIIAYYGLSNLPIQFWHVMILLVPFDIIAFFLYIKALEVSPLSVTVPFLSFTPLITLLFSLAILEEQPSMLGLFGILLVTAGAYIINFGALKKGFWGPIKAIRNERGSLYMIIVAVIFGLTTTLYKKAILLSNPLLTVAVVVTLDALLGCIYVYFFRKKEMQKHSESIQWPLYIFMVFFTILSSVGFIFGIALTKVAYVISIKRLSLLFGVIFGKLLFGEDHISERLAGALLMFLGVVLIILG